MYDERTNRSAPKSPRCPSCARPMQLFEELRDLAGSLICIPFTA